MIENFRSQPPQTAAACTMSWPVVEGAMDPAKPNACKLLQTDLAWSCLHRQGLHLTNIDIIRNVGAEIVRFFVFFFS